MLTLQISKAELRQLSYEKFYHSNALVRQRMYTLYLKGLGGYTHQQIARIVGIHVNTVTRYCQWYAYGGSAALCQLRYGTNQSELSLYSEQITAHFQGQPAASLKEAQQRIEALSGIRRSLPQVATFLARLGVGRHKTGHIPAKADPERQAEYLENVLEPALRQAQQGKAHLLFMDAAHFVLAPFLGWLWSFARVFIKAPAGRQRLNVIGAVDAITKQLHFLGNTTRVNTDTMLTFLVHVREHYLTALPLYLVLDNARYQHNKAVKALAEQLNITLLFLPPYSPNLNLIERLWRFVKQKCLTAIYYENFAAFQKAILSTLNKVNTDPDYQQQIKSLLSLRFQRFHNHQSIP
jgi:transposase